MASYLSLEYTIYVCSLDHSCGLMSTCCWSFPRSTWLESSVDQHAGQSMGVQARGKTLPWIAVWSPLKTASRRQRCTQVLRQTLGLSLPGLSVRTPNHVPASQAGRESVRGRLFHSFLRNCVLYLFNGGTNLSRYFQKAVKPCLVPPSPQGLGADQRSGPGAQMTQCADILQRNHES